MSSSSQAPLKKCEHLWKDEALIYPWKGPKDRRIPSPRSTLSIRLSAINSSRIWTAEPQNKEPQNIEVKNIVLFFQKILLFPPEADSTLSFGLPTLRAGPQFRYWKPVLVIWYWNLRFVCNLVLGVWDFFVFFLAGSTQSISQTRGTWSENLTCGIWKLVVFISGLWKI